MKHCDEHSLSAASSAYDVRQAVRRGDWVKHTSGLAARNAQGNVAILPERLAFDFLRFCQRNPKPCPLLAVSEPGDPFLPSLGRDVDIRSALIRDINDPNLEIGRMSWASNSGGDGSWRSRCRYRF